MLPLRDIRTGNGDDLLHLPPYAFHGDDNAEAFGFSVSGTGDADGIEHFIFGASVGNYARGFVGQISPIRLSDSKKDGMANVSDICPFIVQLFS